MTRHVNGTNHSDRGLRKKNSNNSDDVRQQYEQFWRRTSTMLTIMTTYIKKTPTQLTAYVNIDKSDVLRHQIEQVWRRTLTSTILTAYVNAVNNSDGVRQNQQQLWRRT